MIYLCCHALFPYNSEVLITGVSAMYCFNTDDNLCRIINYEEYKKIKRFMSQTPSYENTYGVGTYFKYKYLCGDSCSVVKWCVNCDIGEVCFESGFLFGYNERYPYLYLSIVNCSATICRMDVKYDKFAIRSWKHLSNLCIIHAIPVELMKNLVDNYTLFKYVLDSLTLVFYDICSFSSADNCIVTKGTVMQYIEMG